MLRHSSSTIYLEHVDINTYVLFFVSKIGMPWHILSFLISISYIFLYWWLERKTGQFRFSREISRDRGLKTRPFSHSREISRDRGSKTRTGSGKPGRLGPVHKHITRSHVFDLWFVVSFRARISCTPVNTRLTVPCRAHTSWMPVNLEVPFWARISCTPVNIRLVVPFRVCTFCALY